MTVIGHLWAHGALGDKEIVVLGLFIDPAKIPTFGVQTSNALASQAYYLLE